MRDERAPNEEVELKFRLAGAQEQDRLRAQLREANARRVGIEHEENRLYDDGTRRLTQAGAILRLRVVDGGRAVKLTYKGPARFDGAIKARQEIEVAVGDAEQMHVLLGALGFRVTLTYEKDRETWHADDVEVALDTLVFGHFCEIEGPAPAIRALATRLGLDDHQAETAGYPTLMARWERE